MHRSPKRRMKVNSSWIFWRTPGAIMRSNIFFLIPSNPQNSISIKFTLVIFVYKFRHISWFWSHLSTGTLGFPLLIPKNPPTHATRTTPTIPVRDFSFILVVSLSNFPICGVPRFYWFFNNVRNKSHSHTSKCKTRKPIYPKFLVRKVCFNLHIITLLSQFNF